MEISSAESLLSQVRDYQAKIASARRDTGDIGAIGGNGLPGTQIIDQASGTFSSRLNSAMVSSLNEVNALQQTSKNSQEAFQMGEDIPLTDVVMNMQKASLAFEATVQVRNKVMQAYQEIMNMPV
ncbi:flagellar hook-basal body complex protein FliE [Gammaproteobacteria bacterium]|nr:flagellar hook-basal body complex protein FliE [Gammaproteobacteria bacterium]